MTCSVCLFAWCKYSYDWFWIPRVCYWTQRWEEITAVDSRKKVPADCSIALKPLAVTVVIYIFPVCFYLNYIYNVL